jgi:endoglucanase
MKSISLGTLLLNACMLHAAASAQSVSPRLEYNQSGFLPAREKKAVLVGRTQEQPFHVIHATTGDTVLRSECGPLLKSTNSSLNTRILDLSSIRQPGDYVIAIPGLGLSGRFTVSTRAMEAEARVALKGFYFQRLSGDLEEEHAGKWHRPAGHPDTAVLIHPSAASAGRPAGTVIRSPGGWYDAGDYNKYIVNSGITVGTLLSAYEDFPAHFDTIRTGIPESGNRLPDLLDEVLQNLRWMLTMQDPLDGGVYHKCTNAAFDGMVMPGVTKLPRYAVMKSTAAALDFTAVTAQAARVFEGFRDRLPGLSDSCLKAARLSWAWAERNPSVIYNQDSINRIHEPDISTGTYGDGDISDEWFWAASEMLATTGEKRFTEKVRQGLSQPLRLASWRSVSMPGYYSLVRMWRGKHSTSTPEVAEMRNRILRFADSLLSNATRSAFGTPMGGSPADFEWGSNAVAANQGIVLVNAYLLTRRTDYLDGALANLDHILGRNATGYGFLTGFGRKLPMHPHHRPSEADGIVDPVPGLLIGGPNPGRQDGCEYAYREAETSYVDDVCSYASNEIAINWNAPLVYLLHAVRALSR